MYCNNSADRTIVKQNHGNWHLIEGGTSSDRGGYLIGQERVPYRTGGGYLSRTGAGTYLGQVGQVRQIGQVGRPQPATTASTNLVRRPTRPTCPTCPIKALPQRHPRKGTPAPPSWLPHIMDNELLLKGGEAPFAGVPIDRF